MKISLKYVQYSNMNENCIFCKIVKKEIPANIVHETEDVLCFLDIKPLNLGHTLVIPKKHFTNLLDTPSDILEKTAVAIKKVAGAIKIAVRADAINIGQNNGKAAGQLVFHTHFHIIPRYEDDGYLSWKRTGPDPTTEEFVETAKKIKSLLFK